MMKKAIVLVLLAAFVVPAFADDALTLPQSVFRTRVVPAYLFSSSAFEDDFETGPSSADDTSAFLLGFALEYGITDWLTAGLQWAPGLTLTSDIESDSDGDLTINTLFDLFAGLKVQVVGPDAPVRNEMIRLALSPGVKIPFTQGADWEDELENAQAGKDFVAANADKNRLGVGGRFHLDFVFSPAFYLNLYSEMIAYPMAGEASSISEYVPVVTHNGVRSGVIAAGVPEAMLESALDDDAFGYGFDLTLELEPAYVHVVSPAMRITGSLPITWSYSPEPTLDGKKLSSVEGYTMASLGAFQATGNPADLTATELFPSAGPSSLLTVGPTVEFFFTGLAVPTALQVAYNIPVAGQNTNANHTVVFQIKNYLKFW